MTDPIKKVLWDFIHGEKRGDKKANFTFIVEGLAKSDCDQATQILTVITLIKNDKTLLDTQAYYDWANANKDCLFTDEDYKEFGSKTGG